MNQVSLAALAQEVKALRYTPAGVPAIEMVLEHAADVHEAGQMRRVEFSMPAIALGDIALLLADTPLGAHLALKGFLAPMRKGSTRLVLHIQQAQRVFPGSASAVV